jgi:hypothetical protein
MLALVADVVAAAHDPSSIIHHAKKTSKDFIFQVNTQTCLLNLLF